MASPHRTVGRRLARLVEIGVENSLLVVLVAALGTVLLGLAPAIFVGDSWMTLVAGREIVEHGLPHRESLTVLAQGRTWTDQQWLAQLAFYGAAALAGLRATMLLHVVLVTSATALAIVAARTRGASARSTLLVVTVCLLVAPWSWTLRAQAFALPLFVATLALLAADRELLRRRTLLVFPLLVSGRTSTARSSSAPRSSPGRARSASASSPCAGRPARRRGAAARSSCCRGSVSSRPRTARRSPGTTS